MEEKEIFIVFFTKGLFVFVFDYLVDFKLLFCFLLLVLIV